MSTSNYYYQHPQIYSPTGISEFLSQKTLCDMATHKIIDERARWLIKWLDFHKDYQKQDHRYFIAYKMNLNKRLDPTQNSFDTI